MTAYGLTSLLDTTGPCFFTIGCSHSELANLAWKLRSAGFSKGVVRIVRGPKMRIEPHFFDEVSAALQFPYYFGENWDALDECLNDLDWLPGNAYLIIVSDASSMLSEDPGQLDTLVKVLKRTCAEWAAGRIEGKPWDTAPTPFKILLHCSPGEQDQMTRRYEAAGLELASLAPAHQ
jgi:RNAse (barnase) inhibitor barstar